VACLWDLGEGQVGQDEVVYLPARHQDLGARPRLDSILDKGRVLRLRGRCRWVRVVRVGQEEWEWVTHEGLHHRASEDQEDQEDRAGLEDQDTMVAHHPHKVTGAAGLLRPVRCPCNNVVRHRLWILVWIPVIWILGTWILAIWTLARWTLAKWIHARWIHVKWTPAWTLGRLGWRPQCRGVQDRLRVLADSED
jgi:hypothetical protein